jgi:hypothetical protein
MDNHNEYLLDELDDVEMLWNEQDKINGHCYIGVCYGNRYKIMLLSSISPKSFFRFPFHIVKQYLSHYYLPRKINILKLCVEKDETYTVILKTYWLRLIQRHWRNVFKKREKIYNLRKSLTALRKMELTGQYLPGLRQVPDLRGMLSCYRTI